MSSTEEFEEALGKVAQATWESGWLRAINEVIRAIRAGKTSNELIEQLRDMGEHSAESFEEYKELGERKQD